MSYERLAMFNLDCMAFAERAKLPFSSSAQIVQKKKFSMKDFLSKRDQMWSHLLKKSFIENLIFCAVSVILFSFWTAQEITYLLLYKTCNARRV